MLSEIENCWQQHLQGDFNFNPGEHPWKVTWPPMSLLTLVFGTDLPEQSPFDLQQLDFDLDTPPCSVEGPSCKSQHLVDKVLRSYGT